MESSTSSSSYQRACSRLCAARHPIVVTGAAGFIGSHLVEKLLSLGQRVVGIDNFATGTWDNLDDVRRRVGDVAWGRFRLVYADILDTKACADALIGARIVFHEAALGSVGRSWLDPMATMATNVDGFANVLSLAHAAGVQRFIYASSSSVYGDDPHLPKLEAQVGRPLSPYGASKRANEHYAAAFSRSSPMSLVGLRYFNVFGPRQDPRGDYAAVIPRWVAALVEGHRCIIHGDGATTRDFTYVDNVVQANILAATHPELVRNAVFNVGTGTSSSLLHLHRSLTTSVWAHARHPSLEWARELEYAPARAGDIRHSLADIRSAQNVLLYEPSLDFEADLRRTVAWYLDQADRQRDEHCHDADRVASLRPAS